MVSGAISKMGVAVEAALRGVVWGGAVGCVLLPLLVIPPLVYPAITGKGLAFRFLAVVMVAAWILLCGRDSRYLPRPTPVFWSLTAFMVVIGIANLQGVAPSRSLWGNLERMEGYIQLLHLYGMFLAVSAVITTRRAWERLFLLSVAVSAVATGRGFFDLLLANALGETSHRVESTLGNPSYLAGYLLLHIFLMVYLVASRPQLRFRRIVLGIVLVPELALLPFTGTRGALLGLVAGTAVAVFLSSLGRASRRAKQLTAVAALALFLGVGAYVAYQLFPVYAPTQAAELSRASTPADTAGQESRLLEQRTAGQLQRIVAVGSTVNQRLVAWTVAWRGIKERPLLGRGQENFDLLSSEHRDPRLRVGKTFDRSHNVFLQWAVAGGLLGLAAFLSMYGAAALAHARIRGDLPAWLTPVFAGMLVAHLVANALLFDTPATYVQSFLLFAFVHSLSYQRQQRPLARAPRSSFRGLAALTLAGLVTMVGVRADLAALQSADTLGATSPSSPGSAVDKSARLQADLGAGGFSSWELRRALAWNVERILLDPGVAAAARAQHQHAAVSELRRQMDETPGLAAPYLELSRLLLASGSSEEVLELLVEANLRFPADQEVHLRLATAHDQLGNPGAAMASAAVAFELDPTQQSSRISYSVAALLAGESALAVRLLAPLPDDPLPAARLSRFVETAVALPFAATAPTLPGEEEWRAAYLDFLGRRGQINSSTLSLRTQFPSSAEVCKRLYAALQQARSSVRRVQEVEAAGIPD